MSADGEARVALVTGMSGGLSQIVGRELAARGLEVIGVDYRPFAAPLDFVSKSYVANYNKTRIEDVFRRHRPGLVLHLGRVGNLKESMGKRFDLNVLGSRKVMDLALKYGVRRLVVLSTFHIYGAHPHNHTPIGEEDPLRAGTEFPQIGDAIQLDAQALLWTYRNPEVRTALLRPCNVIGPAIQNSMSRFLRQRALPSMLGFNPMVQVIHADDLARAILAVADADAIGVYNVAGDVPLPWREVLRLAGGRVLPVPSSFAELWLRVGAAFTRTLPPYLLRFFMYPCVISDAALRKTFAWEPCIGNAEAIRSTVRGVG
jgi:UDP-glucose 4-epimerase